MKNKKLNRVYLYLCLVVVVAAVIAIALCVGGGRADDGSGSSSGSVDEPEITYTEVKLLEKKSDDVESKYVVGAQLNGNDFSVGQELASKIEQEFEEYYALTEVQRMVSSDVWGLVRLYKDNWNECVSEIGLAVDNPLESMEWLNKSYDFDKSDVDSSKQGKHVEIQADASLSLHEVGDKPHTVRLTAGYGFGNLTISLNATLCAEDRLYQNGSVYNGYASFEEKVAATGSDIPVLIVTPDVSNNNGYYSEDYYGLTAYWARNDVFYTLYVHGDDADKGLIEEVLYRILAEI